MSWYKEFATWYDNLMTRYIKHLQKWNKLQHNKK